MDFAKTVNKIENKNDFLEFMEHLIRNLKESPDEWENKTLEDYLDALLSWVENMDGYYENTNQSIPKNLDWKVFADILIAAKMYE